MVYYSLKTYREDRQVARYQRVTNRGYDFYEVASAMQKAIRRGDPKLAAYWAMELHDSGYPKYVWKRLLIISVEDCWGILTQEVARLRECYEEIRKQSTGRDYVLFMVKAVILLGMAKKCRDADHLLNLVYPDGLTDQDLEADLEMIRNEVHDIPSYALDCHTLQGRLQGKTREQFMRDEFDGLEPRQAGLFDDFVPE